MERFESKFEPVTESGCWIWTAYTNRNGYGTFRVGGKKKGAHRVSYELYVGPIPNGMHVLHRCDTPACVCPAHLFLGTHSDNMQDMKDKGRATRSKKNIGSENPQARLTENDVLAIVEKFNNGGTTQRELADEYGVNPVTISDIFTGRTWSHVTAYLPLNFVLPE